MSMQAAVQGLLAASAALRLLHTFAWNRYRGTRGKVSRSALRLHIKVFCGHYAWRFVPMTVCAIPDLLLPLRGAAPSFQGVPLANPRFEEPSVREEPRSPRRMHWSKARTRGGQMFRLRCVIWLGGYAWRPRGFGNVCCFGIRTSRHRWCFRLSSRALLHKMTRRRRVSSMIAKSVKAS